MRSNQPSVASMIRSANAAVASAWVSAPVIVVDIIVSFMSVPSIACP